MLPRNDLRLEVHEWLDRARADLAACVALIEAELPAEALFHAQQCAEKVMKAGLVSRQVAFGKTHDLDELKERCVLLFPDDASAMAGIGELSQYAWRFRYPGAPYVPERGEAEAACQAARALLNALASRLETETADRSRFVG